MPATASRIGFIMQEFRNAAAEEPGVVTKFGASARRSDPIETFFETEADAQAICNERLALLSSERRRFFHGVSGVETGLDIATAASLPTVNVIDDEMQADHDALISEVVIDFANQTTRIETWG